MLRLPAGGTIFRLGSILLKNTLVWSASATSVTREGMGANLRRVSKHRCESISREDALAGVFQQHRSRAGIGRRAANFRRGSDTADHPLDPNDPDQGAFHIDAIWLDADANIYLARFDHMVSKLTRLR
jgi:hypothetical protein